MSPKVEAVVLTLVKMGAEALIFFLAERKKQKGQDKIDDKNLEKFYAANDSLSRLHAIIANANGVPNTDSAEAKKEDPS